MDKEAPGKVLPLFLLLVLGCFLLFLLGDLGLTQPARYLAETVSTPIKAGIYRSWQGIKSSFSFLTFLQQGQKKIRGLEEQVRQLSVKQTSISSLEEENKSLRKQLELPLPPKTTFLLAKTIGLARYLIIDKGQEAGVKPGMIVISENILVGKVLSVSPKTAQVLLPTDPDSKIPGVTLRTQARGLLIGEFGTKIILDKVLQAETLEKGDLVVTTGEGDYLRNLLIGSIGNTQQMQVQPFQKAEVMPLLDYNQLVNVFIID